MTPPIGKESVADYAGFDFRALWPGREKVTAVETELLRSGFASADRRRILEVGTGFGRLLGPLEELSGEVVASDFDVDTLSRVPRRAGGDGRTLRVAANVYHLPFVDGAFTGATMVRVYHHLSDPTAALNEIRRVLQPSGRLLVTYNAKPSVGTLVNDVQRALRPSDRARYRSLTFARQSHVELPSDPFPVHVGPRGEFYDLTRRCGFAQKQEMVSGLEEYYLMRYVPTSAFVRLARTFGRAPGFPSRTAVLAVRSGRDVRFPRIEEILACPRCRAAIRPEEDSEAVRCPVCGFCGGQSQGVVDLRYVPDGVRRWTSEVHND